jgi:hypothetical protein
MIGCLAASLVIMSALCWLADGAIVARPVRRELPRNVRVKR